MEQIPPPLLVYIKFPPEVNAPWASYSISFMWPNCTISTQLNMNGNDGNHAGYMRLHYSQGCDLRGILL